MTSLLLPSIGWKISASQRMAPRFFTKQLQKTIREKLATSPMRWPISRQEPLQELGLRICFGKNLSPYLAIFQVFEEPKKVLVYHVVWERSNYARLFEMDN